MFFILFPRKQNPKEMNFLEGIFSYIFGDGDPNVGFNEDRMKLIAQVIRYEMNELHT